MNLILLLTNKPGIKAKKIAEFFDISERTVYRDLNTLSSAHFPLSSATDKGGGYFIEKDYFLPPLHFTCEEAASILIAW
jgi:predicted DNA-binding transcriptional regulator YafY